MNALVLVKSPSTFWPEEEGFLFAKGFVNALIISVLGFWVPLVIYLF